MPAKVTFASARPKELRADATLPVLLDRMLGKWSFKKRFSGKRVAIKMHLGGHVGYSTIHPLLVSRVVQAVKAAGGNPFITDGPGAVDGARMRGYTEEVLEAPLRATTGLGDKYVYSHRVNYRTLKQVLLAGEIVAVETASLDLIKAEDFIEGSLPSPLGRSGDGHLLQQIHGKSPYVQIEECIKVGLGSNKYRLSKVT